MKTTKRNLLALALATQVLNVPVLQPAHAASWVTTSPLSNARDGHTAILLRDGKVLVAGGGIFSSEFSSAELYDPVAGKWTATGPLRTARAGHKAALLSNGKMLVAGGRCGINAKSLSSAELYDPATGTWTETGALNTARYAHTVTLLSNGKVLTAGGYDQTKSGLLCSAELYDPVTGVWTTTGALNTNRSGHTATLLPNGKVLVTGGRGMMDRVSNAELYDPVTGVWTATGALNTNRDHHTATLLSNGKVLVAGGSADTQNTIIPLSSAELYDPATGRWTVTGALNTNRTEHTATLLPNGKVLVAGGQGIRSFAEILQEMSGSHAVIKAVMKAELYDPVSGTWATSNPANTNRTSHTATLLSDGTVLVAGGIGDLRADDTCHLFSTELYHPAAAAERSVPESSNEQ